MNFASQQVSPAVRGRRFFIRGRFTHVASHVSDFSEMRRLRCCRTLGLIGGCRRQRGDSSKFYRLRGRGNVLLSHFARIEGVRIVGVRRPDQRRFRFAYLIYMSQWLM